MIKKIRRILSGPKNEIKAFTISLINICRWRKSVQLTYAQEGEDILLWRMLASSNLHSGIYVDVGCNHPYTYSNTAFFYERGWSGIVIDPNPTFKHLFERNRKRDVFVCTGVSDISSKLTYHQFPISFYNTFSTDQAASLVQNGVQPEPTLIEVKVDTLEAVLNSQWPSGKAIDLLTIDAEGLDLKILIGHDFERYPTRCIIIEGDFVSVDRSTKSEIHVFLKSKGFEAVSKLCKSVIFFHRSECVRIGIEIELESCEDPHL